MIESVLKNIQRELRKKISSKDVQISIASLSKDESEMTEGIVMTLLHIEEEASVKQPMPKYNVGVEKILVEVDGGKEEITNVTRTRKSNPELLINLYLMFSAQDKDYPTALKNISSVIRAFQSKDVIGSGLKDEEGKDITYKMSLMPMTMEQSLSVWQTFGAKPMPSVVYKVRAVVVDEEKPSADVKLVKTITKTVENKS